MGGWANQYWLGLALIGSDSDDQCLNLWEHLCWAIDYRIYQSTWHLKYRKNAIDIILLRRLVGSIV